MRRGTTPTFTFDVNLDLTGWDTYITFKQPGLLITRKDAAITPTNDGCSAELRLTQAETLQFSVGTARAQIRACKDGESVASSEFVFDVADVLLGGEIPQEV